MQTNEGQQARPIVRIEKDDVYKPPSKENFWEKDDFKTTVTQIKTGSPVASPAPKPTPIPDFKMRYQASVHKGFDVAQKFEDAVRTQVTKEIFRSPAYVHGATPQQMKDFVDKKVQERMAAIKTPRYVMTKEGKPFYLDKAAEREDLEKSLAGEEEGKKKWTLFKYDAANAIADVTKWLSEPSLRAKEVITDTDTPNPAGAVAQLGLNTAILGIEYLRGGWSKLFTEGEKERYLKQAEAVKYTNPTQAAALMKKAEQTQKQLDFQKTVDERLSVAKQAIKRSWEQLSGAAEYNKELEPERKAFEAKMAGMSLKEQYEYRQQLKAKYGTDDWAEIHQIEIEQTAKKEAEDFRSKANDAYATGNYDSAIQLIQQAQDADRRGDISDKYGAYTWVRQPENYKKFVEDAAIVELQKGSPLSDEEIRRLKDYHTNGWTESLGELIFDPLNFVPSNMLEDAIKMPGKIIKGAGTAVAKEFPTVAKVADVMGSPVRWMMRESVASGGNRVARQVNNLLERVSSAYTTTDDMVKAIDEIGQAVLDAKRAPDEAAARAIFENAREATGGLQNITFRDFKSLMDAGEHVDPTQWGKMYSESLSTAEDILTGNAVRRGLNPEEAINDLAKSRIAMQDMAAGFHKAFVDPHRVYKGASFLDDSIAGQVSKVMRELSGQEVNELVKAHGIDQFLIKYGETLQPATRGAIRYASNIVEGVLHVGSFARDVWSGLVLATPRWLANNLMDTAFRDVVYGGNLFDDLGTLFMSTQRTLADELGFVPIEFSQALSRGDLEFAETVSSRLLYENWKPKAGIFSYWNYEYKRLAQTDAQLAKHAILSGMLEGLPEGKLKNAMLWMGDGLNMNTPSMLFQTWKGAISDFNTAVEFTFRLRMFHREYFKLLETLEPGFMARGLDALSPATREIAQQIWKLSDGNPRRLGAYVDSIVGKATKGTPAQWSLIVPNNIAEVTKGMDAVDRQLFVSNVRSALEQTIDASLKSGKELDSKTFSKFFDDYKTQLQDEIQAHMAQTWDKRQAENVIAKDGVNVPAPDPSELKGSAPVPKGENPRTVTVEQATKSLRKGRAFQRVTDIVENFDTALTGYAKVERVAGDGVRRVVRDGGVVVEIGDNVLRGKPAQLYQRLNEVLMDVFTNTDTEIVLRGGFSNVDEYRTVVRRFMDDPNLVLKENERQFMTIANQFTAHPQLKDLLGRTGKDFKYDSALDVYRNFSVYDDAYGFTRPPDEILQEMANNQIKIPDYHVAAAQEEALATTKLGRLYTGTALPETTRVKIGTFMEQMDAYRKQLRQFWTFVSPGPKLFKAGEGRRAAWDMFYRLGAESYTNEATLKNTLVKLFESDPAAAEKLIDNAQGNFADWFLKQNGIDVTWDTDRQMILDVKVTQNGKTKTFMSRQDRAAVEHYFYAPQVEKNMKANPVLRVNANGEETIRTQMTTTLRDTFDLPNTYAEAWSRTIESHAKRWSEVTGQPVEKYYERLGFQRLENGLGIGEVKGNNAVRLVKRGAVSRDAAGNFMFYGLGHSNFESMVRETGELFYDDLVGMAEHSDEAATDLAALTGYIENKTGKKIIGGKLNQDQSQLFTEMFTRYVAEGVGPDIKLKKPFEQFKGWLNSTFEAVHTTPVGTELSDDIYRTMDRMFVESKMVPPKSNARVIKQMAKEAGVQIDDEDALLRTINETVKPPVKDVDLSTTIPASSVPVGKAEQDLPGTGIHFRGTVISADDPMIPDVVYHVTTNKSAVESSGKLKASGAGGLGGDPTDRIVSLTITKDIAVQLEKDLKLAAQAHQAASVDDAVKLLEDTAKTEGWQWSGEMFKSSNYDVADYLRQYFVARENRAKIRNPVLFGSEGLKNVDVNNIGIVEVPKESLKSSNSLITNFDVGKYQTPIGLDEIRVYGDVPVSTSPRTGLLAEQKQLNSRLWTTQGDELEAIKSRLRVVDEQLNPIPTYSSLGDVPKDVAAKALGTTENVVTKEIDEAWQVWKTNRQLKGFPEEALQSADSFKAYLKGRIANEWDEAAQHYNRLMWEVEQFEDAMLNYHTGNDMATHLFPRVPETEISDGMKTWVRNNDDMLNNYESALSALDTWKKYMGDLVENGHPSATLTKEQMTELTQWGTRASADKAELVDILMKGGNVNGRDIEGAIDKVNRVMLDYQHRSVFDNMMKNFFPFWMFPSRSLPFWIETMATHPQLIANYEKIQRLSRTQRYQMGAITSTGKPLPSLDGYIPIPGTDLWFNPLAPFSFRYALDVAKTVDNTIYAANTAEEDVEPKAFMVKEFMQMSQVYGFSVAPWMTFLLKESFNIPDEILPRYPLLPQISLIPRWMVPDMIRIGNKTISTHKDEWNPEVSWHDYMVERRLLEDALLQIRSGNLSESDKLKLMSQTQEAIKNKGDSKLWMDTYKQVSNEDTSRNWASFMTGFYPKPFTDGQAEVLKLRNELNLLKSSMNNEFQSHIFEMPEDAGDAWQNYLNKLDTPEGWNYRLYTDIGWVRNELGEQVSNPAERAKYLAMKIEQDENQQLYYQRMSDLQVEYNKRLRSLPVGATYDQLKPVYDWYSEQRTSLQHLRTFERIYGSNKPAELIMQGISNDWFRTINETKPTWDVTNGEKYDDYQLRMAQWEANLPNIAPELMSKFARQPDTLKTLEALRPDQQLDPQFLAGLVELTNKEGLHEWEKENDDIFDALNNAWKSTYWDAYWNSGVLKGGYEADLAEHDFYVKHPSPPTAEGLYAWIEKNYPGRFTLDDVKKWVDYSDVATVQERTAQGKPEDYEMRQNTWDMLSWLGPGGRNREVFDDAFAANGGDPEWLTTWYQESGQAFTTQPDKLQAMHDAIQKTIQQLKLQPPSRAELVRYVQAQKENDQFKSAVTAELGDSFYDLLDYYNTLDFKAKSEFRGEQSEMYAVIEDYYSMKESYQEEHPVWTDYFGFDLTPTVNIEELPQTAAGNFYSPPNPRQARSFSGQVAQSKSYLPGVPAAKQSSKSRSTPEFNIQSRITSSFSPGFLQTVGQKMMWEISNLYSGNRKLSSAAVSFLSSLASRRPEYQSQIRNILTKNGN